MTARKIAEISADLEAADTALLEAEQTESRARSVATDARNRVNTLQKEMDAALVAMRNAAGNDTDWGQRRRSGQHLAAS